MQCLIIRKTAVRAGKVKVSKRWEIRPIQSESGRSNLIARKINTFWLTVLTSFHVSMRDCEAVCQMFVVYWCCLFSFYVYVFLMLISSLGCLLALLWEGLWLELFRWDKSLAYLPFMSYAMKFYTFSIFVCCTGWCSSSHDCSTSSRIFVFYS